MNSTLLGRQWCVCITSPLVKDIGYIFEILYLLVNEYKGS